MKISNSKTIELKDKYPQLMENCQDYSAGNGWFHLINQVCRHIVTNYPDKDIKITCIKEKFGYLRIYYSALGLTSQQSDDINEVVSLAESVSMSTCESCGKRALSNDQFRRIMRPWIQTLCDNCDKDNK